MQRGDVVLDAHRTAAPAERGSRCAVAGAASIAPARSRAGSATFDDSRSRKALIRRWLDTLLHVADTPERTAAAFAMGVFFGFSPFLGFTRCSAIIVAFLFNLNRVAALLGVYSNLPWIIAPYYAIVTMIGATITRTRAPGRVQGAARRRCSKCRCSTANSGIS